MNIFLTENYLKHLLEKVNYIQFTKYSTNTQCILGGVEDHIVHIDVIQKKIHPFFFKIYDTVDSPFAKFFKKTLLI